jgi:hypothetical protein
LISHKATPTTISTTTMFINGIFFTLLKHQAAIHYPIASLAPDRGGRVRWTV